MGYSLLRRCFPELSSRPKLPAAGDYHGVEVRYYDLLPDKGWQCNIGEIAKLVDPASADRKTIDTMDEMT